MNKNLPSVKVSKQTKAGPVVKGFEKSFELGTKVVKHGFKVRKNERGSVTGKGEIIE
jgi:hypothetical protein